MQLHGKTLFRVIVVAVLGVVLVVGIAAAVPYVKKIWQPGSGDSVPQSSTDNEAKLVDADSLRLPPDVVETLGIHTGEVKKAEHDKPMEMYGQFAPNTDRLFRIRARFPGHVAEIAQVSAVEANLPAGKRQVKRPLEVGDKVKKGQVLAIIWSRDLGEKKSELVDGLSQLRLDEELLMQLRGGYKDGVVPLRNVLEQERRVEAGRIAVERADRTLRSWGIPEEEIEALKKEAENTRKRGGMRDKEQYKLWARWEVQSPFNGTIVEKNANLNEYVDTTSLPLFQLADFSRLTVWAYPYEEDLPRLKALPQPIAWTIRLKADPAAPPMKGTIDLILPIIEPNQRTPILKGFVENPTGWLLSNQSVTATIHLPAPPGEVIVPTGALVDEGGESIVFVQPDPARNDFALRRVKVVRRYHDVVYITPRPAEPGKPETVPLQVGERVVTSGAVLLKPLLEDLRAKAK